MTPQVLSRFFRQCYPVLFIEHIKAIFRFFRFVFDCKKRILLSSNDIACGAGKSFAEHARQHIQYPSTNNDKKIYIFFFSFLFSCLVFSFLLLSSPLLSSPLFCFFCYLSASSSLRKCGSLVREDVVWTADRGGGREKFSCTSMCLYLSPVSTPIR